MANSKIMNLTAHSFEELSNLKYKIHSCQFVRQPQSRALVISFEGVYGIGSDGNNDARLMAAIVTAALTAWRSRGLILDLRGMHYQWGDAILDAIDAGKINYAYAPFPTAILASDVNRKALVSLMQAEDRETREWVFDTLEEALAAVEEKEWQIRQV